MKNPPYQPGELDQKITIARDVESPDGMGGVETVRTDLFPAWALVKPGKVVERMVDGAQRTFEDVTFTIRRPIVAITEGDFISYLGKSYRIRGIPTTNPRQQYIDVLTERGIDV